jgi:hypothetical protein
VAEFAAKFSTGQCPNGDPIIEGQMIMYVDQQLWHVECVDKSGTSREGGSEVPQPWDGTTEEQMGY